jgi:hypothetical protein
VNERIRELAKQTGYIWHASGDPKIYEFTPEKLDKFAELIVKECALVATQQFTGYTYPVDVAGYVTAGKVQSARMIKQHFGIE